VLFHKNPVTIEYNVLNKNRSVLLTLTKKIGESLMKKLFKLVCLLALTFLLVACSQTKEATENPESTNSETNSNEIAKPSSPKKFSLGSGSTGGNFYLVGGGISTLLNNYLSDYVLFTTETTGGSTANLVMLQNGEAELGIAMTSSLAEATEGKAEWTGGKPLDKLRGMVALYPSSMTIYSLKDKNIKSLSDLNGKVVGLGSKGAAMDNSLRVIFDKLGIKPKSIFNDGHGATASAVGDGTVDAAVLFSYPPFPAISELESSKDLNFVSLTEEEQKNMFDTYSFYSPAVLKTGSYKSITEDVATVAEWNMLVTSNEVDEDYVYLMTKTIFENNPDLINVHASCSYATPENDLNFNIPLHAGAVRYLKEIGIDVPAKLIPAEYTE